METIIVKAAPGPCLSAADKEDTGAGPAEPGISRQLKWRRLRKELGLCVQCSKPSPQGTVLCPECSIKHRLKTRQQKGYRSREESGRGRKWKYH